MGSSPNGPIAREPLTLASLVTEAASIYRARPLLFLAIMAFVALPVEVVRVIANLADPERGGTGGRVVSAVLQIVPAALVLPIGAVAATVATILIASGHPASARLAFAPVGARLLPLIGTLVIVAIAVVGGFAFILPGIFLLVLLAFAGRVAVVEGRGVWGALTRSAELVRGAWWEVFAGIVATEVLANVVRFGVLELLGLAIDDLPRTAEVVMFGALSVVVSCIVLPYGAIGVALLYFDRRLRREGAWPDPHPRDLSP